MKKIILLIIAASAACLASCSGALEPDSGFVAGSDVQLMIGGRVIYTCDPLTWQLGYNPSSREFRASDDSMKDFFFVTCSSVPQSKGQKLDATIFWSSGSSTQSTKGHFEVAKVQGDTFWLWCGNKKNPAGVTVVVLR